MGLGLRGALEAFQDRHGLARDALLRPGGPTESRINLLLTPEPDPFTLNQREGIRLYFNG